VSKKVLFNIAMAIAITLILALPAFAFAPMYIPLYVTGDLTQSIEYEFEGQIDFKKQAGHICNTGAEMKQTIYGEGKLEKSSEIYMKAAFIDVMDSNSFVTAPDAVNNIEVVTAIKLCSPAKHVFTAEAEALLDEYFEDIAGMFGPEFAAFLASFEAGDPVPSALGYLFGWETSINNIIGFPYFDPDVEIAVPLTKQIWATSVSADPGQMGNYTGGFKAAYGPYDITADEEGRGWWYVDDEDNPVHFDLALIDSVDVGEEYVGNYFGIEQFAYTSGGVTKRFTSISSPWSHGYFTNDLTVTGMASITEAFTMGNLPEGAAAVKDWWDLF